MTEWVTHDTKWMLAEVKSQMNLERRHGGILDMTAQYRQPVQASVKFSISQIKIKNKFNYLCEILPSDIFKSQFHQTLWI